MVHITKSVHTAQLGLEFVFLCVYLSCMIICVFMFVLPWTVESLPFMFWHWCNNFNEPHFFSLTDYKLLPVRSIFYVYAAKDVEHWLWQIKRFFVI